jgi:hypothetical protein
VDEAKGGSPMQLFLRKRRNFFDFSLTRARICPNQQPAQRNKVQGL